MSSLTINLTTKIKIPGQFAMLNNLMHCDRKLDIKQETII